MCHYEFITQFKKHAQDIQSSDSLTNDREACIVPQSKNIKNIRKYLNSGLAYLHLLTAKGAQHEVLARTKATTHKNINR